MHVENPLRDPQSPNTQACSLGRCCWQFGAACGVATCASKHLHPQRKGSRGALVTRLPSPLAPHYFSNCPPNNATSRSWP